MATVSTGALGATLGLSFFSAPAYTAPTTGIQYATTLAVNWRHLGSSTGSFAVGAPIGTLRFSNPPVLIISGIDPVIQYLLSVRLPTTGWIWPVSY